MVSESNRIEYKQYLTDDLEKEAIAFLNYHEGGVIYIGVHKTGTPLGLDDIIASFKSLPQGITEKEFFEGYPVPPLRMVFPVSERVTPQVTPQVRELVRALDKEMNRQELQDKLKLSDREHFRLNYLKSALDSEFIEMTIPDKPNSRLQKYRLTEKGILLKNSL